MNDATALVIYQFAVAAVVTGTFSLALVGLEFILVSVGGVLVGAIIGWLASQIQRQLDDPPVQTTLSLLTPFAAYLSADKIGVSGVLAVVTAGLYLGWKAPEIINSRTRFQIVPVWEMVVFFLNGLIFILIGLQLPQILENLSGTIAVQAVLAGSYDKYSAHSCSNRMDFHGETPAGIIPQKKRETHATLGLAAHGDCCMDRNARR